jgi:hypothetical protein
VPGRHARIGLTSGETIGVVFGVPCDVAGRCREAFVSDASDTNVLKKVNDGRGGEAAGYKGG